MILERLLGDVSKSVFMEEHFLKQPFSLQRGAAAFAELGTWQTVETILQSGPLAPRAESDSRSESPTIRQPEPDVMVVKEGRPWDGTGLRSLSEARALFGEGYTLLVRHGERHHPGLAELARQFEADFHAPVDVHLYCTPADKYGFGWHYDAEDVFILQTEGRKEYSLRKNTVNPWPVVENLPTDMKFQREIMPVMQCLLAAGDWLYIPHGYWHVGQAKDDAISLAVGVMPATALDAFDFLRQRLLESLRWRQRLPISGGASPLEPDALHEQYRALLADLGDDLSRALRDESFLQAFLRSRTR